MVIRDDGTTFRWRNPKPSRASRKVATSSKSRWSVQFIVGDGAGVIMRPESLLEFRTHLVLRHFPNVLAVEEQVGPIVWTDGKGKKHKATLDLRALLACGTRIGVEVKPEEIAQTAEFKERMVHLREAVVPEHADRLVVISERNLDPVALHNAELLHSCTDCDEEADDAIGRLAANMTEPARIIDLASPAGLKGRGNRAAVRLIAQGVLQIVEHERIRPSTVVRRGGWA